MTAEKGGRKVGLTRPSRGATSQAMRNSAIASVGCSTRSSIGQSLNRLVTCCEDMDERDMVSTEISRGIVFSRVKARVRLRGKGDPGGRGRDDRARSFLRIRRGTNPGV